MKKSQIALLMLMVAGSAVFGSRFVELMARQVSDANWEQAAGGKMEFAVASVRLNKGPNVPSNFPFGPDKAQTKTDELLIGDYTLANYIFFAYKISPTKEQFQSMFGNLPSWVEMDDYEIQARAPEPNPPPDQVRLMLQSLLKERFGLVVHYETQDAPVLVLSFAKQGKLGPKLHRHQDGPDCSVAGKAPEAASMELKDTDIFPAGCGGIEAVPTKNQTLVMGGRNVTLEMMATSFAAGHLGRPIVVEKGVVGTGVTETGSSEHYDFMLKWMPEPGAFGRPPASPSEDDPLSVSEGPTFLEALKDQLGLKLKEANVAMKVLVIDHVERPSEN